MHLTAHASARSLQRNLPLAAIAAAYDYGSISYHRGAIALRLDRRALELAGDDLPSPQSRALARYRGVFVVADGAQIITAARATRRRNR